MRGSGGKGSSLCFEVSSQGNACPLFIQLQKHHLWGANVHHDSGEPWGANVHHDSENADFTAPTGWWFRMTARQRFCLLRAFRSWRDINYSLNLIIWGLKLYGRSYQIVSCFCSSITSLAANGNCQITKTILSPDGRGSFI